MTTGNGNGNGNGNGGDGAASPATVPRRLAHLDENLAGTFWTGIPALSWLFNPADGRLQFRGGHPARQGAAATVHEDVLARALAREVRHVMRPVRLLESLAGNDGKLRQFLVIGFPIGGDDGSAGLPQPWLAGVAIDITDHRHRVQELAHQALVDELTGLYNLRGFFLFAEHELRIARRRGTVSAILYIDVNGLKALNDRHGHASGDALLVHAARVLRQAFRECDVIARLGGDEFAVFAADVKGAPALLKGRLRHALSLAVAEGGPELSLSAGVIAVEPDRELRLTDLLSAADREMYREKLDGRDQAEEREPPGAAPFSSSTGNRS